MRALDNRLHLERVHPHDQRFELVDGGFNGAREVVERTFADAVNPFVRRNHGEQPVLPRIAGNVSIDGGNAHFYGMVTGTG